MSKSDSWHLWLIFHDAVAYTCPLARNFQNIVLVANDLFAFYESLENTPFYIGVATSDFSALIFRALIIFAEIFWSVLLIDRQQTGGGHHK